MHTGGAPPLFRGGLLEHIAPDGADADGARPLRRRADVQIRSVGGAVNDVDPMATAYAHRTQNFSVSAVGSRMAGAQRPSDELAPHINGLYLSFDTDPRPERLHDAFPGETLERLRA